jgi:hypothetical protein
MQRSRVKSETAGEIESVYSVSEYWTLEGIFRIRALAGKQDPVGLGSGSLYLVVVRR